MITKFQKGREKDHNFYIPEPAGPQGVLPFAGTNVGGNNKIKSFKEFAGEYRKGSGEFGNLINRIMEFLRLPDFKTHIDNNDGLKFKIEDFETRSHINVDDIKRLLNKDNNLYSFDININNDYITFSNIKNTYKDRYVSGRKDG